MAWPTEADYTWVSDWEELGYCVTVIKDRAPEDVLLLMMPKRAGRWVRAQDLPFRDNDIEAARLGDWTVVVERNGFRATEPELLTRLSEGTFAAVMYRNVNALMFFQWAVNGTIVRWLDPLLYDELTGEPLPEEEGLPFGDDHADAAAFACAERLTGVRLTRSFLEDRDNWLAVAE